MSKILYKSNQFLGNVKSKKCLVDNFLNSSNGITKSESDATGNMLIVVFSKFFYLPTASS
jgi:hypothetical protein